MKHLFFVLTLIALGSSASADMNRFPRSKVVTGERAKAIYNELREGAYAEKGGFILTRGQLRTTDKSVMEKPVANCKGATLKSGYFTPSFLSAFDRAECRSEADQVICIEGTSGHEILDSAKKMQRNETWIRKCRQIMTSDDCLVVNGKSLDEICD